MSTAAASFAGAGFDQADLTRSFRIFECANGVDGTGSVGYVATLDKVGSHGAKLKFKRGYKDGSQPTGPQFLGQRHLT